MRKVQWNTRYEYEFLPNYKLLQKGFLAAAVSKQIQVERLMNGRYQENFEFCQFMYKLYKAHLVEGREYDALARRRLSGCSFYPEWAPTPLGVSHMQRTPQCSTRASTASLLEDRKGSKDLPLKSLLLVAEKERDLYFSKLEQIERVAQDAPTVESRIILEILHTIEGL